MNAQLKQSALELYIGGANVAGILGVSPYRTPYAEYLSILEGRTEEQDAERARFFARRKSLEPVAAGWFEQATGLRVVRTNQRYTDAEFPFLQAEIDFETEDGCNGETKTVHPLAARDWGAPGEDACPVYVTAQAMHGLMLTPGRPRCYVQALIGFDDDRVYRIERDEETIAAMRAKEVEFWHRVMDRNPPDPMASSDLLRMFLRDAGTSTEVEFEQAAQVYELKAVKAQIKELEQTEEALSEAVKLAFKDSAFLTVDAVPIASWKSQDTKRFNQTAFAKAHPDLFEQFKHTTTTRVLRLK